MFPKKKFIYCNNCDKIGHDYKSCPQPITSWGIILVSLDKDIKIKHVPVNIKTKHLCIKPKDFRDLELISMFMSSIRFLMVRRKHSLGYVEFIRGRYKPDNVDGINFLFEQMVAEEIEKIGKEPFDKLWYDMWGGDEQKITFHKREYELSKSKFEQLKDNKDVELPLDFYVNNAVPIYKTHEWGFPKGRRNKNESVDICAIREFCEETGINQKHINIIREINPIEENLIGTNGVKYRHIYYVAELNNDSELSDVKVDITGNGEIGGIDFFDYNNAMIAIREYHLDKRSILTGLYMYYIELFREYINEVTKEDKTYIK